MPLCLSFVYLRPGARLNYKTESNLASREAGIPRALPGALPAALSEIARLSAVSLIRPQSRSFVRIFARSSALSLIFFGDFRFS